MDKILLIIPAFNESENLPKLINDINKEPYDYDILIINDYSTDNTAKIAKNLGVNIINLPCNLGIGGSVQTGYKYALENEYDYAIQVDGDGQHDPRYLELLHKKIKEGYNFVVGSRFIEKKGFQSTFTRRIGIQFFYYLIKVLTKQEITDATSGFRIADKSVIKLFSQYYPSDYPEPETIILLLKNNFKIAEIPVVMKERANGKSSINFVKSIYYMIKVTLAILLSYFSKKRSFT
ncbi:TPA: glycosyltransferase family 2 protein [Clostridium perfringens]|nr:glycosyltransferase family 2 protein [Clostridium perfringens]HBC2058176.1 glycosyltransferase family 2 protein [Clostridium perfringens]HBC2072399.1 glycosyltransferase family 2 protein [Clostridium perfringens]